MACPDCRPTDRPRRRARADSCRRPRAARSPARPPRSSGGNTLMVVATGRRVAATGRGGVERGVASGGPAFWRRHADGRGRRSACCRHRAAEGVGRGVASGGPAFWRRHADGRGCQSACCRHRKGKGVRRGRRRGVASGWCRRSGGDTLMVGGAGRRVAATGRGGVRAGGGVGGWGRRSGGNALMVGGPGRRVAATGREWGSGGEASGAGVGMRPEFWRQRADGRGSRSACCRHRAQWGRAGEALGVGPGFWRRHADDRGHRSACCRHRTGNGVGRGRAGAGGGQAAVRRRSGGGHVGGGHVGQGSGGRDQVRRGPASPVGGARSPSCSRRSGMSPATSWLR